MHVPSAIENRLRATRFRRDLYLALASVAALACGCDNASATGDAGFDDAPPDAGPCWPSVGESARGAIEIGTGRGSFETMTDPLPIEYGLQDGFDLVANIKMSGLAPGDPSDFLDPDNPRTRVRAYFAATNVPLNFYAQCPFRNGYVPTGDGKYTWRSGLAIVFETCWRAQHLIGQQVRIDAELVDRDGYFAKSSVTVTLAPPADGFYPMEPTMPGCVH
jgi:hypothetical protein